MNDISFGQLISETKEGRVLDINTVNTILDGIEQIFDNEPNVLYLEPPIVIAGDTHGQLEDVIYMFQKTEDCPQRYLFLGDYVDRGPFSIELLCILLLLKYNSPNNIFMLRGNHETKEVNNMYGFINELVEKYGEEEGNTLWNRCNAIFEKMPLAAVIDNRIFCVHGGLAPNLEYVDQIKEYNRKTQPELNSIVGNMLWSDPSNVEDYKRSERRSGYLFGEKHVKQFLNNNNFQKIVRSHEMADGYQEMFNGKLITVWSAPNYCFVCGNKASVMIVYENCSEEFLVYEALPNEKRFQPHSSLLMKSYFDK